ncbi:hypothetical protein ANCDUO_26460 [Ancylostoma duodenale]|uniref:Uncharacterized protein n=1 Tax=Ancylostoma duodenale TaxID=51022 RepID=A0A0C2BIC8_9BILA|nr:hypothetical protein ANCDUO_26460 [Ancylostoma duodenale]
MSEIVVYRAKGRLRALDQAHECVSQEIDQLDKNVDKILDQINSTFQVRSFFPCLAEFQHG